MRWSQNACRFAPDHQTALGLRQPDGSLANIGPILHLWECCLMVCGAIDCPLLLHAAWPGKAPAGIHCLSSVKGLPGGGKMAKARATLLKEPLNRPVFERVSGNFAAVPLRSGRAGCRYSKFYFIRTMRSFSLTIFCAVSSSTVWPGLRSSVFITSG